MFLKNSIPLPAWTVCLLVANIQWAAILEVMETTEKVGGINNILHWNWLVIIVSYSFIPFVLLYVLSRFRGVFAIFLPFIGLFFLDLADLLDHFETGSPYAGAQFILFIATWIIPSIFLFIYRRRFSKMRMSR